MILIEAGRNDARGTEGKLLFAAQLMRRGHDVGIALSGAQDPFERNQKYELAPLAVDPAVTPPSRIFLTGAEDIADETLLALRAASTSAPIHAIGRFGTRQGRIGAISRLAYATGQEPLVLDLDEFQPAPLYPGARSPLAVVGTPTAPHQGRPEVLVYVPPEMFDDPVALPMLAALDRSDAVRLSILTTGRGKEDIRRSRFADLRVFGYSDLPPQTLSAMTDIAVFLGQGVPGERMALLALDVLRRGGVVIDGTTDSAFAAAGAPVLRGPAEPAALLPYLEGTVLPHRRQIGDSSRAAPWLDPYRIERIEAALGLSAPAPADTPSSRETLFLPTNGNGLGHARRCLLIAAALPAESRPRFAAFPSCAPMIAAAGRDCLPLVPRSEGHPEDFANDLVNYLRLTRSVTPGTRFVFDGGYVFDSVYRTILENRLSAVWIRRGLWQPGQTLRGHLDREGAFDLVIAPDEAFPELNAPLSAGPAIRQTGPIVDIAEPDDTLRARLLARYGREGQRLVISMLGAGVAADRTAQLQALAARFDTEPDLLHLILVWPGARVAPALFGWQNTRVVQSRHALSLAQAADFVISATGYNAFHETLYNRIPAIFVPQVADYMDDQRRRARAAADRGLAEFAAPEDLLMLDRAVTRLLNGEAEALRTRLAAADLPAPGMADAARLIAEDAHGDAT